MPHAECHHVGRPGTQAALVDDDVAVGAPEAVLDPGRDDQVGPVPHRDVLTLAVHVDVAGGSLGGDHQVPADTVRAEAEVSQRLERTE